MFWSPRLMRTPHLFFFIYFILVCGISFYIYQKLNIFLRLDLSNVKSSKSSSEIDENSLIGKALKEAEKLLSEGKFNFKKNQNLLENVGKKEKKTMLSILIGWMIFIFPLWIFKKLITRIFEHLKSIKYKKFKSHILEKCFIHTLETWRISKLRWGNL